jgi:hypothetical protein
MFDASAWVVRGSCSRGLYHYGWGHRCLRYCSILEWYVQHWGCMDWALSDHIAVLLFLFIEVIICVRLVFA